MSDAFAHGNGQSKMELLVRVLNINGGHNSQLMERCPILKDYAVLIGKVKAHRGEMDFGESVKRAVEECIAEGVLREFLMTRRAEVMNSILTEYDEEKVLADIGQERYEDGKAEGKAESILELLEEGGDVPEEFRDVILSETNIETLKRWLKLAARADSIKTFKSQM